MSEQMNWTQNGKVYLWRYHENRRNYPGWHMTADADGCQSLLALLDEIAAARFSCEQRIALHRPDDVVLSVPNNRGGKARHGSPVRLVLRVSIKSPEDAWKLTSDSKTATLNIGRARVRELRDGFVAIRNGRGDYAIGPEDDALFDNQCLWFWWYPKEK